MKSHRLQRLGMTVRGVLPPILLIATLLQTGCATVVIPPERVDTPATVYIVDHGRHASLLLPKEEDGFVEYAYGDWRFFALNEKDLVTGFTALAFPTTSAFGRGFYDADALHDDLVLDTLRAESVDPLEVEHEAVIDLASRLNQRFEKNKDTMVVNDVNGLTLVKEDSAYHVFNNSNQVVARWLRQLGCHVKGPVLLANFRVKPPPHVKADGEDPE
jgi:hypothetical protein